MPTVPVPPPLPFPPTLPQPMPASTPIRATLRQFQIFIAVAGRGSTTGAAADLALSQSATSAALNELESLLGTRLFDRVGKRLALNDGGRTLLPQARRLVEGAQALEARFTQGDGVEPFRLQIGASTTIGNYVLPPLIASFLQGHPAGRLELRIGNTGDVASAVAAFTVDIGFIEGPCHEREMQTLPWMTDELVIVAAASHPLAAKARRGKLPVSALQQAQWLLREPGSGTRDAVLQALLPHLTRLRSPVELGSTEAIKTGAAAGLGLACLSRRVVADFVALGRLVELRTTLPPLRRALGTRGWRGAATITSSSVIQGRICISRS